MENKYFIKECTLIPTEGSSLSQPFEISGGNPTITYYEIVKSPSISMTITFLDVDQLISREAITGGGQSGTLIAAGVVADSDAFTRDDVDKISGEIIYIENRAPVTRAANQTEDIKVVITL